MRVLITGGHLTPALAVIEEMPKDWEVVFVGRKFALEGDTSESLEYKTINGMGIEFYDLKAGRIQRSLTKHTIPSMLRIPKSYLTAFNLIKNLKPDIVVGFGGYISVPVVITAKLLGIPTVVHEQTIEPGASNKILSSFVDKILISWIQTAKSFPKNKTVLVGNPVRKNIMKQVRLPEGEKPLIFVTGGSTGSHTINVLIEETIDDLLKKYRVFHQVGDSSFKDYERLSQKENISYIPVRSVDPTSMGYVFENASLVISRAGINTITELIKFSKPAVLIPLLTGQKNEQERNAIFLKSQGLAEILNQNTASSRELFNLVNHILENLDTYKISSKNLLIENAAKSIIDVLVDVANKKTKATS